MRKRGEVLVYLEIIWFEYSGSFIVPPPPQTALLSYGYDLHVVIVFDLERKKEATPNIPTILCAFRKAISLAVVENKEWEKQNLKPR